MVSALSSQDGSSGGIAIKAAATNYKGRCPVTVHFRATFSYERNSKVTYHWERGDGKRTPRQSRQLPDGRLNVDDDFAVGEPGQSFTATDRLHVSVEGMKDEIVSPAAESTGICAAVDAAIGK